MKNPEHTPEHEFSSEIERTKDICRALLAEPELNAMDEQSKKYRDLGLKYKLISPKHKPIGNLYHKHVLINGIKSKLTQSIILHLIIEKAKIGIIIENDLETQKIIKKLELASVCQLIEEKKCALENEKKHLMYEFFINILILDESILNNIYSKKTTLDLLDFKNNLLPLLNGFNLGIDYTEKNATIINSFTIIKNSRNEYCYHGQMNTDLKKIFKNIKNVKEGKIYNINFKNEKNKKIPYEELNKIIETNTNRINKVSYQKIAPLYINMLQSEYNIISLDMELNI